MRISFTWHFHTKYSVSPPVLYYAIPLLNEDLLRFHLLELSNRLLSLFEFLPLIRWHSKVIFRELSSVEILDGLLGFLGVGVNLAEFFTLLVEWNVVEDTLAAKCWDVVSPQKT